MWTQSRFSSGFSKSFFWLVCLLPGYYCAAVTRAQFTERNAVNFLVALGGYGLFFLFLGANFFSIALFNFLSRSLTLPWGHRGEPPPTPQSIMTGSHITSILGFHGRPGLCFLLGIWRGQGKKCFSGISQCETSTKPTYETLTEDGGLLVVEVTQM